MKHLFTTFLIILTTSLVYGQTETTIVGIWKVKTAKNENGVECEEERKVVYKLQFNSDGTYLKEEMNFNGRKPMTTEGTYSIIGNKLQLTYKVLDSSYTLEIQILSFVDDILILAENICPLRDEISTPELILKRVGE